MFGEGWEVILLPLPNILSAKCSEVQQANPGYSTSMTVTNPNKAECVETCEVSVFAEISQT